MSFEKSTIDPEVKEKLAEEGFEDNAAVIVGKKEEAERQREIIEKEGKAENLGTYIKMHKEIAIPHDILTVFKQDQTFVSGEYDYYYSEFRPGGELYFVDSDLNLARVKIDFEKINELNKIITSLDKDFMLDNNTLIERSIDLLSKELKNLGFTEKVKYQKYNRVLGEYRDILHKEAETKKGREFDF